jgi:hypothetical protein
LEQFVHGTIQRLPNQCMLLGGEFAFEHPHAAAIPVPGQFPVGMAFVLFAQPFQCSQRRISDCIETNVGFAPEKGT